jgi:malate dehydrogenase (oxaloacetate-decarboxylating)(NADP+)
MGGIMSAIKNSGVPLRKHRLVFLGAGSAAIGVGKQILQYFLKEGLSEAEAKAQFYLVDRHGLVTTDRGDELSEEKKYFARMDNDGNQLGSLEDTADHVKPTILIGLSGVRAAFSKLLLQKMAKWNKLPIIFPLSNPVSHSECTYNEALVATEGRVLFASGSPFHHQLYKGKDHHPAQGNNM